MAVCTVGASFAAYADDVPSGSASDMELIQRREQASGSQNEAGMHRQLLAARIMLAQRKDSRQQRTRRQEITDRLLLRHRERSRGQPGSGWNGGQRRSLYRSECTDGGTDL